MFYLCKFISENLLYKYYNNILNILLSLILFFGKIAYSSSTIDKNSYPKSDAIIGIIKIEKDIDKHENNLHKTIKSIFNIWRIKTIFIDYNQIINLESFNQELFSSIQKDRILMEKSILNKIEFKIKKLIKSYKINKIFISGSYCSSNYESKYNNSADELINKAIIKIVNDDPKIHLLGTCNNLQSILNIKNYKITNTSLSSKNNQKNQKFNLRSKNNSKQKNGKIMQQIKIIPNSCMAKVIGKFLLPDKNGWFTIYLPNSNFYQENIINNIEEIKKKIELVGYKIAAFSNNGIIEAIEDKNCNIYFQSNLEKIILEQNKNYHLNKNNKNYQVLTFVIMAIINDFIYRI